MLRNHGLLHRLHATAQAIISRSGFGISATTNGRVRRAESATKRGRGVSCSSSVGALLTGLLMVGATAPAPAAAQDASLQGLVTDAATGQPLPGASVSLARDEAVVAAGIADRNGFYQIGGLTAGEYSLSINHLGYIPLEDVVSFAAGEARTRSAGLAADPLLLDEIVGGAVGGPVRRELGRQRITPAEMRRVPVPAASGDLASYLQTLPGVVTAGDRGGQLFVRGGTPSENLALVDGLLIYQPFHIVGFFSAFPEELVSNADFYAGGFGARYNGRASSVLDVQMRDGDRNRAAGSGAISPFLVEAVAEGPLSGGRSSFIVSARRSLLSETSEALLGQEEPLHFESQFAKITFFGGEDESRCSAMGLRTADEGRLDVADTISHVGWTNLTAGGRCVILLEGTQRLLDLNIGMSRVENDAITRSSSAFVSSATRYQAEVHTTELLGTHRIEAGAYAHLERVEFDVEELFALQRSTESVVSGGLYTEGVFALTDRLTVQPGMVFALAPRPGLEPRVRASWKPWVDQADQMTAAVGYYRQPVTGISDMRDASSVFLAWMRVPGREPSSALHATLGWQQDLWGGLGWSIEGYYKDLGKVPVPVWTSRAQFNTDIVLGDGQVRGADLRLELNRPEVYGFIGYGYSWTEYESAQDHFGVWFGEPVQRYHPAHDRRHQVNAMLSFDIAGFTTGARWQLGTGLPFTRPLGFDEAFDFRHNLEEVQLKHGIPRIILDRPFGGRLPDMHRLDVSVARSIDVGAVRMELQGGAINAYDRTNMFYYDLYTQRRVDQLPFVPYASLRVGFRG